MIWTDGDNFKINIVSKFLKIWYKKIAATYFLSGSIHYEVSWEFIKINILSTYGEVKN